MTVVVDVNILIAFGLADEPLHTQANQLVNSTQAQFSRIRWLGNWSGIK